MRGRRRGRGDNVRQGCSSVLLCALGVVTRSAYEEAPGEALRVRRPGAEASNITVHCRLRKHTPARSRHEGPPSASDCAASFGIVSAAFSVLPPGQTTPGPQRALSAPPHSAPRRCLAGQSEYAAGGGRGDPWVDGEVALQSLRGDHSRRPQANTALPAAGGTSHTRQPWKAVLFGRGAGVHGAGPGNRCTQAT